MTQRRISQHPILDAAHIYDVKNIVDRDRDSEAEVFWSSDGLRAGLLINDYLHAVIDFERNRIYCRSNFPPPGHAWSAPEREPWNDAVAKLLD